MQYHLDLLEFVPKEISSGRNKQKLNKTYDQGYITLSYSIRGNNNSTREYSTTLPRKVKRNERTFEVIGLLQAEMGKTQNGNISFSNNQEKITNYVLNWFEKELNINKNIWKWSIKLNINEPNDQNYKREIENKLVKYWINKTRLSLEQTYPKKVTYIKNTNNTKIKFYDKGTLVLEHKNNLLSQIIKNFVKEVTYEKITKYEQKLIRAYMRGIIAGESTIDLWKPDKRYRVYISASKEEEKEIFHKCLKKLGIDSIRYKGDKLVISKRENNIKLLNQRLMTLHPKKYNKFLDMMKQYPNIEKETGYFKSKGKNVWNKILQEKIDKIIEIYKSGISRTKDIAEEVGVSKIKVQRVLKEHNLGERVKKTPETKRKEIAKFAKENPQLSLDKIAKHFNVHTAVAVRADRKYNGIRGMKANCKIPEEKIKRIIEIYKQNPIAKFSDIQKEVCVSSSVIKRVRKENNLKHLGFMHLIGNNNRKYKEKEQKP